MTEQQLSDENFLVASDVYFKAGVHIGTKFKTSFMKPYIYKVRQDGLSIFDVAVIDEHIKKAAAFLAKYNPQDITVCCRRENGWRPVKLFGASTGIQVFPGRYQPGILTNIRLEQFIEGKVMIVTDPWPDRNAIKDAKQTGMKVIALCDTNNETNGVDIVIPCNNKGRQALGLVYYLLAKEYNKVRGLPEMKYSMDDFLNDAEKGE